MSAREAMPEREEAPRRPRRSGRALPQPGLMPAWRRLAAEATEGNPFFAPTVLEAAIRTLAPPSVAIALAEDDAGRLLALAPVVPVRLGRLARAVSVWTHLYGPLGTPLVDPADPEAAIARLIAAMEGPRRGRRILVFPDLPLDGPVAAALARHAARAGRPVAHIGGHERAVLRPASLGGDLRSLLPAKLRKELGRQLRRLGDLGPVEFATATMPAELPAALERFLALEASGWKGARGTALALKADALAFVRAVADGAAAGDMRIDELSVGGRSVAMLASFRAGGSLVTWKIAHDEGLGRFSPGVQVMLAASERFTADPSLALADSLATAGHPMIDRLWPQRQAVGTLVVGPEGGGAAFALGVLLARAEVEARARLRVLIRRRSKAGPAREDTS